MYCPDLALLTFAAVNPAAFLGINQFPSASPCRMREREQCDRIGTEGCLTGNGSLLLVTLGFRVIVPRYAGLQRPELWADKNHSADGNWQRLDV